MSCSFCKLNLFSQGHDTTHTITLQLVKFTGSSQAGVYAGSSAGLFSPNTGEPSFENISSIVAGALIAETFLRGAACISAKESSRFDSGGKYAFSSEGSGERRNKFP